MIESFISILPALIAGTLLGVGVGLIPSLGMLQVLSVVYLFMQGWTPLELLIFYIAALTVSQYIDAVPAIYLGVPGETSAIPTAYESRAIPSHELQLKKNIIRWAALSRTVGCMLAVLVTLWMVSLMDSMPALFSSKVQSILFLFAVVGIAITANNRVLITVVLMASGYLLGMVGYNFYLEKEFLTLGFVELYNGIPLIPIIMGIYVVPSLIYHIHTFDSNEHPCTDKKFYVGRFSDLIPTVLRSSTIGYLLGLIPGVSYILSSSGSYYVEKSIRTGKHRYQHGDTHCIIATETGNSVGAFSTLLPLMIFGIPITVSETLIFDMMIKNGAIFQQGQFLVDNISVITIAFLVILMLALMISWPLAEKCLALFQKVNTPVLYHGVILVCILTLTAAGWANNQLITYLVIFLCCLIPGILLRKNDVLPLLFMFILQNSIESSWHDFAVLYL